jgi:hypothetical protein
MESNTVRAIPFGGVVDGPDSGDAGDVRSRGVGEVKTSFSAGRDYLGRCLEWANELTAVPADVRKDLAEIVNRLKVIGDEVERIR